MSLNQLLELSCALVWLPSLPSSDVPPWKMFSGPLAKNQPERSSRGRRSEDATRLCFTAGQSHEQTFLLSPPPWRYSVTTSAPPEAKPSG